MARCIGMSGRVFGYTFGRVPTWLLDAAVSDPAVGLFALLTRYADRERRGFPGRRALAERLRCSVDSVDRALRGRTDAAPPGRDDAAAPPGCRGPGPRRPLAARAPTATPMERASLWPMMAREWPAYDEYQNGTSREIPIMILERA